MHVISLYMQMSFDQVCKIEFGGTSTLQRYLLLSIWLKKCCLTLALVKVPLSLFTKLCFSEQDHR